MYKIFGPCRSLGEKPSFFVSLGIAEIVGFLSFLFILKLSYSKPFHNTLNDASTANIEEVMKFYNLGDKTFETDFNTIYIYIYISCIYIYISFAIAITWNAFFSRI